MKYPQFFLFPIQTFCTLFLVQLKSVLLKCAFSVLLVCLQISCRLAAALPGSVLESMQLIMMMTRCFVPFYIGCMVDLLIPALGNGFE